MLGVYANNHDLAEDLKTISGYCIEIWNTLLEEEIYFC
mgnify:CR=1 FL=1